MYDEGQDEAISRHRTTANYRPMEAPPEEETLGITPAPGSAEAAEQKFRKAWEDFKAAMGDFWFGGRRR